jgi:transketolase
MTPSKISCRQSFSRALCNIAQKNKNIYVITSDSKGSATLENFEKAYPDQFVEVGIAEQDAIGIGAGLAKTGKRVFVCGPASFYSARCLDQVKVDVAYAHSDVKIIGISGGVSYGALGSTHHSLHDIAVMRTLPGLAIYLPCDNYQTTAITELLANYSGPAYMRMGRNPVADVYTETSGVVFRPGKANKLHEGNDCTIIAAGEMVQPSLGAAMLLEKEGIQVRVLDFWSIKPLDADAIASAARETGLIITVEEHSIFGGLGAAVSEVVVQTVPVPMKILGFPDEWTPSGSSRELFEYYGFTAEKISDQIRSLMKCKERK